MEEILKNITMEDLEKLKVLFSILPNQQPKEIVTLRVFRDEYLNMIKSNMSKSYYNSVNIAFNYLLDYFTQKDGKPGYQHSILSLQQKDVEYFLIYLQQKVKSVSHSAIRSGNGYMVYFRNLKAAFNKAKEWNYVKENYFLKVKMPKKQKIAPVFINSDQLSAISNQIKNIVVKDVVVFAFYTGMRLDEIVNLRWKNIDLQNSVITVGDEEFTTKGRNQRYIPICEEAFVILVRRERSNVKSETRSVNKSISHYGKPATRLMRLNQTVGNPSAGSTVRTGSLQAPFNTGSLRMINEFVFCKIDGKKFTGDYFSRRFKRACSKAELDKSIHFHSLRHSFASNLVQKGVSLYTVKELLGHASISTTEIYSHLNMDSLREAVEKLAPRYEGQGTKDVVKEKSVEEHTPSFPPAKCAGQALSRGESNEVKIYRINAGEMK